jgi:hypothetical protein
MLASPLAKPIEIGSIRPHQSFRPDLSIQV